MLFVSIRSVSEALPISTHCSSAAKRSTLNQYVCKYIGRINDQSNWSGPFSLVVMTLDYRSRVLGSIPGRGNRREYFIYRSLSPPTTPTTCFREKNVFGHSSYMDLCSLREDKTNYLDVNV